MPEAEGITARIGDNASVVCGIYITSSDFSVISVSPSTAIATTCPPLAFTSSTFQVFSHIVFPASKTTTGIFLSIRAIGHASSLPRIALAWIYETSLSLRAPSSATGKPFPRPNTLHYCSYIIFTYSSISFLLTVCSLSSEGSLLDRPAFFHFRIA